MGVFSIFQRPRGKIGYKSKWEQELELGEGKFLRTWREKIEK